MPATAPPVFGNWKFVALLSAVLGLVSLSGMAWLGRGFFRALNGAQSAVEDATPAIVSLITASPQALKVPLPSPSPVLDTVQRDAGDMYAPSRLLPTTWRVVKRWPHDPSAFTQGLVWRGDRLYEGTGLNGESRLRRVDISGGTWSVEAEVSLSSQYFGEGIVVWTDAAGAWLPRHDDGTPRDVVIQARLRL